MPAKKNDDSNNEKEVKVPNLDDLLEDTEVSTVKIEAGAIRADDIKPGTPSTPNVTDFQSAELEALQKELAEAKAELARERNHPTDEDGRPLPDSLLTPEQRELRDVQDQLAKTKGKNIASLAEEAEDFSDEEGILIHILADGFTVNGRVAYRGEEIVFGPAAYKETVDRFGESWLDLDDEAQYAKWGNVQFRKGPWPGQKRYEEDSLANKNIRSVARIAKI